MNDIELTDEELLNQHILTNETKEEYTFLDYYNDRELIKKERNRKIDYILNS